MTRWPSCTGLRTAPALERTLGVPLERRSRGEWMLAWDNHPIENSVAGENRLRENNTTIPVSRRDCTANPVARAPLDSMSHPDSLTGLVGSAAGHAPIISFSPCITRTNSSADARASRRPIRSLDSVRTWLIFTHDRRGRLPAPSSSASGKPAPGSLLVRATAITVPERSLKTS